MEAKLRHQQIILFYSGGATILFSFWSLVKHIFSIVVDPPPWEEILAHYDIPELDDLALADPEFDVIKVMREGGNTVMILALLIGMVIYLYLGVSAIKDAAGKKKRFIYIILTAIVFIAAVFSSIFNFQSYMKGIYVLDNYAFYEERLSGIIIEAISQLCLLIIVVAGCRARWLRKKIAKTKTGE